MQITSISLEFRMRLISSSLFAGNRKNAESISTFSQLLVASLLRVRLYLSYLCPTDGRKFWLRSKCTPASKVK